MYLFTTTTPSVASYTRAYRMSYIQPLQSPPAYINIYIELRGYKAQTPIRVIQVISIRGAPDFR